MKLPKGYTLIELLVVIAIIGIIGVVVLSNYRSFGADQILKNAALDIQSQLRVAQTNASSGIKCSDGNTSSWWVSFNIGVSSLSLQCQANSSVKVINLPANIKVDSITGCSSPTFPIKVTFAPLSSQVNFVDSSSNNVCKDSSFLEVKLIDSRNNTRSVTIKKGGSIEIN